VERADNLVLTAAQWLRLALEGSGAVIIGIGFAIAAVLFIRSLFTGGDRTFTPIRLVLARHLALALEFQLGADILSTAVAPTWDQIGKLAAIAIIRTGLNYFLSREMADEQLAITHQAATGAGSTVT
jgi:uncharacterized membrane protein